MTKEERAKAYKLLCEAEDIVTEAYRREPTRDLSHTLHQVREAADSLIEWITNEN